MKLCCISGKKKRKTLQKTKWKIAQGHGDQNEQRSINASSLPKTVSILRIFQFCFKIPSAFLSQVSTALGKIPWWCSFVENEKEKKKTKKTSTQLTSTIALKNTVTVPNTHSVNVAIAQGASIHSAVPLNGRVVSRKPRKSVQGSCAKVTVTFFVTLHEQPIMLRCVFGQ